MGKILSLLLLFCTAALPAYAGEFNLSGYLKNETALFLHDDQVAKNKNIFQISGEYKVNENWAMFVSGKYWYDAAYDVYDRWDKAQYYMGHVQRVDYLRDCYIDYTSDQLDVRLGRQQVVWGQADGIPILDRVNPFDATEYVLQDMVDLRIPLWMANIKYSPKLNSTLQLLIIPEFEQSTAAPPGAPFTFRAYKLFNDFKTMWETDPGVIEGLPLFARNPILTNIYYPAKQFKNSKFGVQWQDKIGDWEYTLNYLYGYDYLARTFNEGAYVDGATVIPLPPPAPPIVIPHIGLDYSRRFKRVQMVGGSINHTFTREGPLQGITLRGDAAVYINEPTSYGDVSSGASAGVNRWNNVFWLMGLDKAIFTKWLVSFQFAQYIMEHDDPGVAEPVGVNYQTMNSSTSGAQDAVDNIFTLKIATSFMYDRIKPEVLWSFTDDSQGRINPKITYEIRDNLWLTLGSNLFYGDEKDSNGQFSNCKEIYTNLKLTF